MFCHLCLGRTVSLPAVACPEVSWKFCQYYCTMWSFRAFSYFVEWQEGHRSAEAAGLLLQGHYFRKAPSHGFKHKGACKLCARTSKCRFSFAWVWGWRFLHSCFSCNSFFTPSFLVHLRLCCTAVSNRHLATWVAFTVPFWGSCHNAVFTQNEWVVINPVRFLAK